MFEKYQHRGPSPDQVGQNLWAWGQDTMLSKAPLNHSNSQAGWEHWSFLVSLYVNLPGNQLPELNSQSPVAISPWCQLFGLTHPHSAPIYFPIRSSVNALRIYKCLRNSVRELHVHDHDGWDFLEPQREWHPGGADNGSTSSSRKWSSGIWPPMILGNHSLLLPDQALCREAPCPLSISLSSPCSSHWAFPNPDPGSCHLAWPLHILHLSWTLP